MNTTDYDHHSFCLLLIKFKHAYDFNMIDESGYIHPKDLDDQDMPMRLPRQLKVIR